MRSAGLDEWRLEELFAMQWFVCEPRLQRLADEVKARYGLGGCTRELDEDELDIFAAGDPNLMRGEQWDDKL